MAGYDDNTPCHCIFEDTARHILVVPKHLKVIGVTVAFLDRFLYFYTQKDSHRIFSSFYKNKPLGIPNFQRQCNKDL